MWLLAESRSGRARGSLRWRKDWGLTGNAGGVSGRMENVG